MAFAWFDEPKRIVDRIYSLGIKPRESLSGGFLIEEDQLVYQLCNLGHMLVEKDN